MAPSSATARAWCAAGPEATSLRAGSQHNTSPAMLAFILRRLIQAMIVMVTVAFIAFTLFQYVGDPVTNLLGQDATPQQREALRRDLGLDQPFFVQFARFAVNAA